MNLEITLNEETLIKNVAEGATKATLTIFDEKITEYIKKFKNKELAFIEDQETIDLVVEQRKTPEWNLFKRHITDKDLLVQVEMGISLEKLQKQTDKYKKLRSKVHAKYGPSGLHVAELVCLGIFPRYVQLIIGKVKNEKELTERVNSILHNIDKYVVFVQATDKENNIFDKINQKLNVLSPNALILFSKGKKANKISEKVIVKISKKFKEYHFEIQENSDSLQRYYFILKSKEDIILI